MLPLPGRFSTTNCWPSARDRRSVTSRQMVSGAPPAACDTITFTGRAGHDVDGAWACAHAAVAASAAPIRRLNRRFAFIGYSSSQLDDFLGEAVQLLGDAGVADQVVVAAPAEGALGDVRRV